MATNMTLKRVIALASVVAAAAFSASAQTRELNPTVKVLARPQSPVPAECATDPATVPALEAEAPAMEPVTAPVPPSNDLRASLRRLQVAAEGDDYAAFKSAFAEARRAAASHPPGGERNAANEALQVFTDIGRVWDYAMTSPTGSFFDSSVQSGSLLNALKRYPDYGRTIADQTITAGGKTLYPTPETRRFLSRESARRLTRLGVSTPARVARGSQPEPLPRRIVATPPPEKMATKPAEPKTKKAVAVTAAPKKSEPNKTASTPPALKKSEPKKTASTTPAPKKTEPKPSVKAAKAAPPKTKEVAIKATPVPKPAAPPPVKVAETATLPPGPPIVSTPQPTPRTTTTAVAPPPLPTATTTPATTTTAPPPTATSTTDTTVSTTSSSPTDTSVTAAPDTATTGTAVPSSKQNGNMNLILAVVLILVGIGVLVVLFRASD